jgi:hypothetical protein
LQTLIKSLASNVAQGLATRTLSDHLVEHIAMLPPDTENNALLMRRVRKELEG